MVKKFVLDKRLKSKNIKDNKDYEYPSYEQVPMMSNIFEKVDIKDQVTLV